MDGSPDISIVIPTRDRPDALARTLSALDRQELGGRRAEIVLVDNGSAPSGRAEVGGLTDGRMIPTRVVDEPTPGPAAARNAGVAAARAALILFMGDDTPPARGDLVRGHLEDHDSDPDAWRGVIGPSRWDPSRPITPVMAWIERSGMFFNYDRLAREGGAAELFYTNNVSLTKEALDAVGGFDERFPYAAAEDYELAIRLFDQGFTLDYRADLLVDHAHVYGLRQSLRRMEVAGRADNLVGRLHPGRANLELPDPHGWKGAVLRALVPVARWIPAPRWLPRPIADKIMAAAHRAAALRGYRSRDLIAPEVGAG